MNKVEWMEVCDLSRNAMRICTDIISLLDDNQKTFIEKMANEAYNLFGKIEDIGSLMVEKDK